MKSKAFRRKGSRLGSAPGTLAAREDALIPIVRITAFGADDMTEAQISQAADIVPYLSQWPLCWINVDGLGDPALIADLGRLLELHPLALEDVVNTHQRAKVDMYDGSTFIAARMIAHKPHGETALEQVSLFVGKNFVLSFQERPSERFDMVRDRIRKGSRRLRGSGPDYLAYALLDAMVDSYFPLLEHYGERIDALEDQIVEGAPDGLMAEIHDVRRSLQGVRHIIWPLREALSVFSADHRFVQDDTRLFLRDCQDHVVQQLDILENYRERAAAMTDLYLSVLGQKTNSVMKTLTIITTVFMPLSFVAGVYGMNFDTTKAGNMPELHWPYAYPVLLMVMVLIAAAMFYAFRRAGWWGGRD